MNRNIFLFSVIIVAFLIIGIFMFIQKKEEKTYAQITLGVSLPLTGPAAQLGNWALEGVMLAEDEEDFKINIQDDNCNSQSALSAFQNLKTADIKFIIGPLCNAASIPVSKVAEEEKIVIFTVGVSTKAVREAGDYSFTILPPIESQTKKLADYIIKEGIHEISIIYVKDEYGVENKETFESVFSQKGKIINVESFDRDNADFRSILTKIKYANSKAVVIIGYSPNFINTIKQMNELNVEKRIFSVSNIQDPNIIIATGKLSDGIIYTYPQISDSEQYQSFLTKYNKKFGKNATMLPMYIGAGYDAAKILSKAIKICGYVVECVKTEILKLSDYKGINGVFTFDKEGNPSNMPIELRIIANDTFVKYSD